MFYFSHNLNLHNWNELTDHTVLLHDGEEENYQEDYAAQGRGLVTMEM